MVSLFIYLFITSEKVYLCYCYYIKSSRVYYNILCMVMHIIYYEILLIL